MKRLDFTKTEKADLLKAVRDLSFMLALYSEEDRMEDAMTQKVRAELRPLVEDAFSLRDKVEKILEQV